MNHNYLSLFPEYENETVSNIKIEKSHEIWVRKKSRNFGMEHCSNAFFQGKYGIPQIKKYTGPIPDKLITLDKVNNIGSNTTGITTFVFDYILDDVADNPEKYQDKFSRYAFIAEPDFSMKVTDPLSLVIANTLRSHSTAFYYQEHGCKVMPVMKWSTNDSYEVCFDGYEKGGVVMLSTIGVLRDERSHFYFKNGIKEMLRIIAPEAIILYGDINEWIMGIFPDQLDIHHFNHERFNRMRNGR
ncbi:MAG: DUF4417 domain-containing protein [Bacteroidales bacterium]|nr:DUF4417 domain-containing protein [Candidatus Scybalocola fimicaballi]MCQ2190058.1 DUF4417 domain-containing protein [Paludibacteraceae bacterium]